MNRLRTFLIVGGLVVMLLLGSGANAAAQAPQSHTAWGGGYSYQVHYGDSLSGIAAYAYGNQGYWSCIAKANNLWNPNYIWAGEWLWLPQQSACQTGGSYPSGGYSGGGGGWWYTVRPGDTLSWIACAYDSCNYWGLANVNGIYNPNRIYVGQHIWIP